MKIYQNSHCRNSGYNEQVQIITFEEIGLITIQILHPAENAATGIFPSLDPIDTDLFDAEKLGLRLKKTIQWEKVRKAEIMTAHKANLPLTK